MVMKNFKDIYEQEYQKLNSQQKRAVDTVEGPVMVIAGPGTGKTQILSRRVANILTNYHTNPEEIVCLTYTEAGASEMLDRLEGLIGEEGRNVRVSTIHSFCSELILENSDLFGEEPKVITTAAKYEILKDIIDEHVTEESPLYKNSGNRYSSKEQLLELFTRMKRENLNKDDFEKEIDEYFKMIDLSIPGDELYSKFKYARKYKDKKAGDYKEEPLKKLQENMKKLLAGVEIIEKYSNDISDHNYFDFDDMILWTIEKLKEEDTFQRNVSDDIKYLFVDEFQDTSVVQNELVDLLVKGKKNPNIFVVGDDDQSIYRFQGVSANNIRDFNKKYRPTKIVLEENYRSSQAIIDASRQLISHNPRVEKVLVAAGDNKDYDYQLPILKSYPNAKDEMFGVLSEIKELIQSGVSPQEIGVIYGRNSYGEEFAKILRDNGIFVQMKENQDLFKEPIFKKIIAILKYLCQPSRDIRALRNIVYFDFFEVELSEIAKIRNLRKDEKISIPSIAEIDKKLEMIRKKVSRSENYLSPMYVLGDILKTLGIDEYIMKSKEKYHLVSVLNELYKLMSTECLLHPKLTVKGFLNQLSSLQEMKISLPIEEISGSPSNCVQLMTAHGSKGLEFEHVFMMKCNDGNKGGKWPGGENNSGRFSYPPSLNGKVENESQLKEEENRRLFYVAMTRAKKVLHLSYSDDSAKTHFINEFENFIDPPEVTESFEECQSIDEIVIPKFSDDILSEILGELSLSVSTLNAFLKCPLSFYFNKGLKLPSETNEAMVFGSIIHEVLEKIYISMDDSQSSELTVKTVLPLEEALQLFETIFEEKSYQISSDRIKKDAYVRGRNIIKNLYKKDGYLKDGVIAVEQHIKGIKLGNILNTKVNLSEVSDIELNGKIDKIECEGNIVRLIDYKTGNAENARKKLVPPSEKEPLGGDYWRQAVFYYILVSNAGIDISDKEILVKYVFVENSTNEDGFSETNDIRITQKEVDVVLSQIKDAVTRLKQGDFNCGCGLVKKDGDNFACDYCLQALANVAPKFDNTVALEVATYQQVRTNYKSLSVSKLNHFLGCPKSIYFDDILQLSQPAGLSAGSKEKSAKATAKHAPTGPVFGTAIHETMEQIYKEDLQLEEAIEYYDNSLHLHQEEIIDIMSVEELKEYGHHLLTNLFEHYIPDSLKGKNVCLEKELRFKLGDKHLINGIIDKLEFDNDLIRVVDYKTGSAQRGVEELAVGRDYWRQAVFYNILLENSSEIDTTGKRIETQYIFLDDDNEKEGYSIHTVNVAKEDMDLVLTQIQEFWDKVNVADFTGGCGKEDCDYCRLGQFVDFQLLKENVKVQSNN
ncbi:ATP-dependent DNA helicase [Streptococcus sp. HMSC076C09]|uniref:ATP-dependent helicase n=1 Tax=Streptococcus sp. HMSC076C09 TaxID=1715183 RepID=UPI0008A8E160|nr:ATP-dependent DNA helicase [Streptococcus sp. HMSC076C09]OHQ87397.1 chromosome partitioning protein ParA [Streptococcus sp. HMSC076C09]